MRLICVYSVTIPSRDTSSSSVFTSCLNWFSFDSRPKTPPCGTSEFKCVTRVSQFTEKYRVTSFGLLQILSLGVLQSWPHHFMEQLSPSPRVINEPWSTMTRRWPRLSRKWNFCILRFNWRFLRLKWEQTQTYFIDFELNGNRICADRGKVRINSFWNRSLGAELPKDYLKILFHISFNTYQMLRM